MPEHGDGFRKIKMKDKKPRRLPMSTISRYLALEWDLNMLGKLPLTKMREMKMLKRKIEEEREAERNKE